MLKHEWWERSNNCWKIENNKVIEWGNVHIGDINGALQRSLNNKESFWKYKLRTRSKGKMASRTRFQDECKLKWVIAK